jgi:hypothetical protein
LPPDRGSDRASSHGSVAAAEAPVCHSNVILYRGRSLNPDPSNPADPHGRAAGVLSAVEAEFDAQLAARKESVAAHEEPRLRTAR